MIEGLISRGRSDLDIIATNIGKEITEKKAMPPLESEDDRASDHEVLVVSSELERIDRFNWVITYQRKITTEGEKVFDKMMEEMDWSTEGGACAAAAAFSEKVEKLMDAAFPVVKKRVKDSDDPWIDDATRRAIKKRKKNYLQKKDDRHAGNCSNTELT